ncbi:glycosyltransferase family 4 protein [Sulfuracidifex metallicus]|uniref:glycosyltransferase family 4 protein n=1 Tax=Sulfuracidifex metallicus TaxID=47303 RepID=UPI0022728989|nr:glycosyltransferase family 4 protein [Sulfuracidifex metallicus]MCY0849791.1 glycosyltransferase family 4 protein [Sulfuracidifex metallicus]
MNISVNTQTPPIRFTLTYKDLIEKYGYLESPVDLSFLSQEDYHVSVGGVSKMMMNLLERGNFNKKRWVSLGPGYPPEVLMNGVELSFVDMDPKTLSLYTNFKEGIYNESHNVSGYTLDGAQYIAYVDYNWNSAKKLLQYYNDTDVFFINDFQQLLVGGIIGPSAPAILWYHIPFVPENISPKLREFLLRSFEGFDTVIISTKRDLEGLIRSGAKVRVKQIYPFIDPNSYLKPSRECKNRVMNKFGISENDKVVLVVARMDPMKSQDLAIQAINKVPNVKLVLAGNGSFTSKTLGNNKAGIWARKLKGIAKDLHVDDRVIFTGYVNDDELNALYEIADVVLLPSRLEGFGLVVIEGWVFEKPVVVSKGAGVSELVIDGGNGYTFNPNNVDELAEKIKEALKNDKIGILGKETAKKCFVENVIPDIKSVFQEALDDYRKEIQ